MRHLLIRLLLLALCFHTAVGRPAHEASHFVQAVERVAVPSSVGDAPGEGVERGEAGQGGKGAGSVDGLCAWCLAFAHFAAVLDGSWPAPPAVVAAGRPAPALATGFLAGLDRWRFSARDPPAAPARG